MQKGNLSDKFNQFTDHWNPRIIAELNGQAVKIAKFSGEFTWHMHEHEDEMFMVINGSITIDLRDQSYVLNQGDYFVVPRGVEHRPRAEQEAEVLMFEPGSTLNTGGEKNEFTKEQLDKL
ncbi:MAG: cupin domain-containing protein [Cyclobacteriaceae bacterium]